MAEEKEKFNKKWLILIAILVLIVIIVVTIILCLPGNPASTVSALRNQEQTFLLKDTRAKILYNNFEFKVENSDVKVYSQEMEDVETVLNSMSKVVDKYEDYAVFFEMNDYFYNNYKIATEALNKLESSKSAFVSQLENVEENYDENSSDFLRKAWLDMRVNFVDLLENLSTAFNSLNKIFANSYFGLEQNLATTVALNAVADYTSQLAITFSSLEKTDTESEVVSEYAYNGGALVRAFANFASSLFNGKISNDSKNFYLDQAVASNYEKINSFYTVFDQDSFQAIIASAKLSASGVTFSKTFENVKDENGCLTSVKNFLGGNNG